MIFDFELAKVIRDLTAKVHATYTRQASPRWAAPEITAATSQSHTKSDTWSFGMVMYEVFELKDPFHERKRGRSSQPPSNVRPERPECDWVTDAVWSIMENCWKYEPEDRPDMGAVKEQLEEAEKARIQNSALAKVEQRNDLWTYRPKLSSCIDVQ